MSASSDPSANAPRKRLPVRPSVEHLKKQAKRAAKAESLPLAKAQHRLAGEYGYRDWAELMRVVETMNRGSDQLSNVRRDVEALPAGVRKRDVALVRQLLAAGNFTQHDLDAGLAHAAWYGGDAPDVLTVRRELFDLLLAHGADPDGQYGSAYGPIVFGTGECQSPEGLQWLLDAGCDVSFPPVDTKYGRLCALDHWLGTYLRDKNPSRKRRGIDLLLRHGAFVPPVITPAVLAIHRGEAAALAALLDADPSLLHQPFADTPYGNVALRGATLLHVAVDLGHVACVERLLDRGAPVDAATERGNTPLWFACRSAADDADRLAVVRRLLERSAHVNRHCEDQSTPLHVAAGRGPIEVVELLLRHGAREWMADKHGRLPRDYAARGDAADQAAIVDLLTRPVIRDPNFRAAVAAVQAGDVATLRRLLIEHPNLATDAAVEPDCYPPGYFGNPKLLWFVANNPNLVPTMPANMTEVTETILNAGVEAADVSYTLGLVMTSDPVKAHGLLGPLMTLLKKHGAKPTADVVLGSLGHGQREAIELLLAAGVPMTAPIAAGLGRADELAARLDGLDAETLHDAFSMAVINGQVETTRQCLAAGADVNRPLRVHTHSTALHHAAGNGMIELIRLLLANGADRTIRDSLWRGTPLGWAEHGGHAEVAALLVPSPGTPREG